MPIVRREYRCENNHPWNVRVEAGTPQAWPSCPVCGEEPVMGTEHELVDRPLLGIESATFRDERSGRLQREKYYFVTVSAADGTMERRTGHPRSWPDTVALLEQLREMTYEQASRHLERSRA